MPEAALPSIPPLRLRALNRAGVRPDVAVILYWMTATRRLCWSYALDRAVEHAKTLGKPLLIFEPLNVDYRWASDRQHHAILDGMAEHERALSASPVGYFPYVEPEAGARRGLLRALAQRTCVLVTDDSPVFFTPRLLEAAGRVDSCCVEAVDSCGLLPLAAADRAFSSAYHFRRFLQKALPDHLLEPPHPDPLGSARLAPFGEVPADVRKRWPQADFAMLSHASALSALPIDHSVGQTGWGRPWPRPGAARRARTGRRVEPRAPLARREREQDRLVGHEPLGRGLSRRARDLA